MAAFFYVMNRCTTEVQRKFNRCTMIIIILADNNSFSGIDIVRFGNNSDEIYERKTVENISVLGLLDVSYDMFHKYYQYEKIEGEYRSSIDRIPENAFREAIANAIVHRNWDVKANIKISFYEDCIEIISPGGLVSGISEEEYLERMKRM